MKLIYCSHCEDIRKLDYKLTTCKCGRSFGQYAPDGLNAMYGGDATPLGLNNQSFTDALTKQPESGRGKRFGAFVIPKKCPTFSKVSPPRRAGEPNDAK